MTTAHKFITFNGEFPGDLLSPLRELATLLAPYDQAAKDAPPEELLTYFQILELDEGLAQQFLSLAHLASMRIYTYFAGMRSERQSVINRKLDRFFGRMNRIGIELRAAGFPLTANVVIDIDQGYRSMAWIDQMQEYGLNAMCESLVRMEMDARNRERVQVTRARFNWLICAEAAGRSDKMLQVNFANDIFQLLRYLEIDFSKCQGIRIPVQAALPGLMARDHIVEIRAPLEPWSLCAVHVRGAHHNGPFAIGAISRLNGEITNHGCIGVSVKFAFDAFYKGEVYDQLRAAILISIYQSVAEGLLHERVLMQNLEDSDTEDDNADTCADSDPAPAPPPPASTASGIAEVPAPETATRLSTLVVGRSKYSWRNLVATLRQFGAELIPGGKHPKIVCGGLSANFLNPHGRENPHHNKRVLRETLLALGIDEQAFVAKL